jgi:hypothetical protein
MRHKSIIIKHRYDINAGELKAYFTEHYDGMHVVMKIDCLIDAMADIKKELEKQKAICYPKKSYK